jgi:hypothetical protein
VYALTGLGVVMQPDGGYTVPGWCSWLPFSSFNDACKLPTTAQVRSNDMSNLGGHSDPARVARSNSNGRKRTRRAALKTRSCAGKWRTRKRTRTPRR